MASTWTLQALISEVRSYPELTPVLGVSGYTQQPALSIANRTMQFLLAQPFNMKFNRGYLGVTGGKGGVLTVALQQDYLSSTVDLSWLEQAWRLDINNSTNSGNMAPKPIFNMETCKDLAQTAYQANPFYMSFIPNTLAFLGQWFADTEYGCGYGVAQVPISPIQQFQDANGNLLYIDSTVLGLNINSPGFANGPVVLPTPNPYGVSGSVQPVLPANTAPGTTVTDGTVTWTVADPNGYAIRVAPLPAYSGLCWLMTPVYQKKPPIIRSLQQLLAPIPDECIYLFRDGFLAGCYEHAGSAKAGPAYAKWEESIQKYLQSGDRERDDTVMYPSESLSAGGGEYRSGLPIGAAWPFQMYP